MTIRILDIANAAGCTFREAGAMVANQVRRFGVTREAAVRYLESVYGVQA